MIEVEIQLFGALRDFDDGAPLILKVPANSEITLLREQLLATLKEREETVGSTNLEVIVEGSAFADEKSVLHDDFQVTQPLCLAVLPPVCGG